MDGPSSLDVDGGDRQGRGEQHPYTLEGTPSIREYLGERMGKGVSEEIILSTRVSDRWPLMHCTSDKRVGFDAGLHLDDPIPPLIQTISKYGMLLGML